MSVRDIIQAAAGVGGDNAWDLDYALFEGLRFNGRVSETVATDVKVSPDGTKMYVLGSTNDGVLQYNLSTPYDVTTATFLSANVSAQVTDARGVSFKTDGTKMYVTSITDQKVAEYNLSVAWDITTLSFVQDFSTSAQSTGPLNVFFKDDGTVMFLHSQVGFSAKVFQYSLSTPWDISTASYTGYNLSLGTGGLNISNTIAGIAFGNSGSDFYASTATPLSGGKNQVHYSLSTPWDLSTATFVDGFDTSAGAIQISSDGTEYYIVTTSIVRKFNLSTPYSFASVSQTLVSPNLVVVFGIGQTGAYLKPDNSLLFTAGSTSQVINVLSANYCYPGVYVGTQTDAPTGMSFKSDGTELYIVDSTNDIIYSYGVSTAWDLLTTDKFVGIVPTVSTAGYETTPTDIQFNSDGTKMYVLGDTRDAVLQYDLSTAYSPSTGTLAKVSVAVQDLNSTGVTFKPDGTKMYTIGFGNDAVEEYDLSIAWDVTTATYIQNFSVSTQTGTVPRKVQFKDDGTKMYVLSQTNDSVFQYSLSTAWNISTATYDAVSFSVASQESSPDGMFFGDSGSKMYIVGSNADRVFQYTLSSAWDLSTASYSGLSFFVQGQDLTPADVFFKDDGTVMYVLGNSGDDINQYALSTAWNVSTASFTKVSSPSFLIWYGTDFPRGIYIKPDGTQLYMVSGGSVFQNPMSSAWNIASLVPGLYVNAQEATPTGVAFKSDGTKMYVVGTSNDTVYQYSLSTAWDVLAASYDSVSFSVAGQETEPRGITFKSDGTKMYIIGSTGDDVNEYALSVAWDISTASFTTNFSVATQTGAVPQKVQFKSDGTKMFVLSETNGAIYEYALSSAWDVSTASYSSALVRVTSSFGETACTGFAFSDDGTQIFVIGQTRDLIITIELATAWTLSTAKIDQFFVGDQETVPNGITFKTDGTKMYVIGSTGDDVNEYDLSTAWNVYTASYVQNFSVATQTGTIPQKVEFSSDGTKMLVASQTNNSVYLYNLSSAWNISTASYSGTSYNTRTNTGEIALSGLAFSDSGAKMYIIGNTQDRAWQFNLQGAWDISGIVSNYALYVGDQEASPQSVTLKTDGAKMYVLGGTGDDVNEYDLSTAYQVASGSYIQAKSVAAQTGTSPVKVQFKDDGTKMYVLSVTNDTIFQYSLSTAWDVSTATYDSISFSVTTQEATPRGMFIGDSGTKLYVVGETTDTVYQYTLSSAWDLSTASYSGLSKSVNAQEAAPYAVFIGKSGSTMYILGTANDTVYQYTLSTPWDVSTATYASKSFLVNVYDGTPTGLWFKDDGLSFYITGSDIDTVWQFTIS